MSLQGGLNPGNALGVGVTQLPKRLLAPDVGLPELVNEPSACSCLVLKLLATVRA